MTARCGGSRERHHEVEARWLRHYDTICAGGPLQEVKRVADHVRVSDADGWQWSYLDRTSVMIVVDEPDV